jgi:osmoprotectant transport system ATP-binding protein
VTSTAAVELRDVVKRYPGGRVALDAVSLRIETGEVVALVGASGSGKTTALKTINRLVDPDSGDVRVQGESVGGSDPVALRRRIGYVIQESGLLPHFTVAENVDLVPRLLGWTKERRQARRRELLELVGLDPSDFEAARPAQLSGGQRQRVGIARALAADPPILLMDEPFSALDPLTRRRLQDEFRDLQSRLSKTVVIVTHDLREALRLGHRVAVMNEGRVLQVAPPDEIRHAPEPGFVQELVRAALD